MGQKQHEHHNVVRNSTERGLVLSACASNAVLDNWRSAARLQGTLRSLAGGFSSSAAQRCAYNYILSYLLLLGAAGPQLLHDTAWCAQGAQHAGGLGHMPGLQLCGMEHRCAMKDWAILAGWYGLFFGWNNNPYYFTTSAQPVVAHLRAPSHTFCCTTGCYCCCLRTKIN
jgi:hypothetical protein